MKVKIFQAAGAEPIDDLEPEINDWIEQNITGNSEVKETNSSLCQIGPMEQHMVVCVWYGPR